MTEPAPTDIVQSIYADFSRGDVAAIVARFHPDALVVVHAPDILPYAGARRGLAEAEQWFADLGATIELDKVEAETIVASGDEVVVRGYESGRARATGRPFATGFAHVWRLRDGLVVRFDDFIDSAALVAAVAA